MTAIIKYGSLTRIADLQHAPFVVSALPRDSWDAGDYVVGEVISGSIDLLQLELPDGRMSELALGDLVVGAFGQRAATLEAVGDWTKIGSDSRMQGLTSAGLFGRLTSRSPVLPALTTYEYRGHVLIDGAKASMSQFVPRPPPVPFDVPTVLIIGTSMTAGKTTSGKAIVRILKRHGLTVAGAKLTGAGRYRDILALGDAGADTIHDFVDAGLPSTVCSADEYRNALDTMLALIASGSPDVLVAEAGASPQEPYNGEALVAALQDSIACVVLAASDPYAVVGVTEAFRIIPDVVTGLATATTAGVALIKRLTGFTSLNVLAPSHTEELTAVLQDKLQVLSKATKHERGPR